MPQSGLIATRMVIIGIQLQTWMRVIVDVDVSVRFRVILRRITKEKNNKWRVLGCEYSKRDIVVVSSFRQLWLLSTWAACEIYTFSRWFSLPRHRANFFKNAFKTRLGHRSDTVKCASRSGHFRKVWEQEKKPLIAWHIIGRFSVAGLRLRLHFRPESWNFWNKNYILLPEVGSLWILWPEVENFSPKIASSPTGSWEFLPGRLYLIFRPGDNSFYQFWTKSFEFKFPRFSEVDLNSPAGKLNLSHKELHSPTGSFEFLSGKVALNLPAGR